MVKGMILTVLALIGGPVVAATVLSARENVINTSWQFSTDQANWQDVSIPHDYSIRNAFGTGSHEAESGYLPGGTGYYRRKFTIAAEKAGSRVLLEFDGVYQHATVKVNGVTVGENHYGYNNFCFDVTDQTICDGAFRNVVEVEVKSIMPNSRWYPGAGIEREVKVFILPPTHVVRDGAFVTTPNLADTSSAARGLARTQVEVANDGVEPVTLKTKVSICEIGSSTELAAAEGTLTAVAAGAVITNSVDVDYAGYQLWSPASPHRYQAKIELLDANSVVLDTQVVPFGYRWVEKDDLVGFKINGERLKLHGADLHHDLGAFGGAYNDGLWRKRLLQLQDMGVNALRLGHNPYPRRFMALCDELGILTMVEFFDGWYAAKNGNSRDFSEYFETVRDDGRTWAQYVVDQTVRRDRNSPSVFLWDLGDEVSEGDNNVVKNSPEKAGQVAAALCTWVQANDSTRAFIYGDNRCGGENATTAIQNAIRDAGGWAGVNYGMQQTPRTAGMINTYGAIIETESSSAVSSRGYYAVTNATANAETRQITSYDGYRVSWGAYCRAAIWYALSNDQVMGQFIWTGFDYIGEPTPWNSNQSEKQPNSSYFGRIDTCGFEKDAYYLYRANWKKDGHTLHLVGGWQDGNQYMDGDQAVIWVYGDVSKFKLFLGDDPIAEGTRVSHVSAAGSTYYTWNSSVLDSGKCAKIEAGDYWAMAAQFKVDYDAASVLTAVAYDDNDAVISSGIVGRTRLAVPNASKSIVVEADADSVAANADNIVRFTVDVKDSDGQLDLLGTNTLAIALTGDGEIVGVDNGNPASLKKFQAPTAVAPDRRSAEVEAFAGKALVLVRATGEGTVALNVTSPGLVAGNDSFDATARTEQVDPWPDEAVALQNVALVTTANTAPTLPLAVKGLSATGSETGDFAVTWDAVTGSQFATAGAVVTVSGTATVNDEPMTVTAKVRVAAAPTQTVENISGLATEHGTTCGKPHPSLNHPNHENRPFQQAISAEDKLPSPDYGWSIYATVGQNSGGQRLDEFVNWLTWDTTYMITSVEMMYFRSNGFTLPTTVKFYTDSACTTEIPSTTIYSNPYGDNYQRIKYALTPSGPLGALYIKYTSPNSGSGVNVSRVHVYVGESAGPNAAEPSGTAQLASISVDATPIAGFNGSTFQYAVPGGDAVTAVTAVTNAGVTVLDKNPANDTVYVVSVSEDGSSRLVYSVSLSNNYAPVEPTEPTEPTEPVSVPDAYAMRNIATVFAAGAGTPTLPGKVWGLTATGETNALYNVTWTNNVAGRFASVGTVMVGGYATVNEVQKGVTASVRVVTAQPVGEVNCSGSATGSILSVVNKGFPGKISDVNNPISGIWDSDVLVETKSGGDEVKLKQEWSSAQTISKIKLCYLHNTGNNWCMDPDSVAFYSDAACTQPIATDGGTLVSSQSSSSNGDFHWYEYVLDEPMSLTTLVGSFRQSEKKTVIIRFWAFAGGAGGIVNPKSTKDLAALVVDGDAVAGFTPTTYAYTVENGSAITGTTAASGDNVGITILGLNAATTNAYVVTVAEDGVATAKYSVYMPTVCRHLNTHVDGAVEATCLSGGSSGTTICDDCGKTVHEALVIDPLDHLWNDGVVVQAATPEAAGVRRFTCQRPGCGQTRDEVIPRIVEIVKLRNVAGVVTAGTACGGVIDTALPETVVGLTRKGETNGEFVVSWATNATTFATAGTVVVTGTVANVNGQPMEVMASVRVVEGGGSERNLSAEATLVAIDKNANTAHPAAIRMVEFPPSGANGDFWTANTKTNVISQCSNTGDGTWITVGWPSEKTISKVRMLYYDAKSTWCDFPTAENVPQFYTSRACTGDPIAVSEVTYEDAGICSDGYYRWYEYTFATPVSAETLTAKVKANSGSCQVTVARYWAMGTGDEDIVHIGDAETITPATTGINSMSFLYTTIYSDVFDTTSNDWGNDNYIACVQAGPLTIDYTWAAPGVSLDKVVVYSSYRYSVKPADTLDFYVNGSSTPVALAGPAAVEFFDGTYKYYRHTYRFAQAVTATSLQVNVAKESATSQMIVNRVWPMCTVSSAGGDGDTTPQTAKDLAGIDVDDSPLTGFAPTTYAYTAEDRHGITGTSLAAGDNVGVTILPLCNATTNAYAVTVAEDGVATAKYSVYMPVSCVHPTTNVTKTAQAPTCTAEGWTAELTCTTCGRVIQESEHLSATGHLHVHTNGAVAATCTVGGMTGTATCDDCGATVAYSSATPPLGHEWNEGVVVVEPTEEAMGVRRHTCVRYGCGATEDREIPKLLPILKLRNVAGAVAVGATSADVLSVLPETVVGLKANGETNGAFAVTWTLNDTMFATAGTVSVNGVATVNGKPMPVTASVRVIVPGDVNYSGEASDYELLHAGNSSHPDLVTDTTIPSTNPFVESDVYLAYAGTGTEIQLRVGWNGSKSVNKIRVYYYWPSNSPYWDYATSKLEFYSDAACTQLIAYNPVDHEQDGHREGGLVWFDYTFTEAVSTDTIVAKMKSANQQMVVTRFWVTGSDSVEPKANANLGDIQVDNASLAGFAPTTYVYEKLDGKVVTGATAPVNTGITILPYNDATTNAYVVTVSEAGGETGLYVVHLPSSCPHARTNVHAYVEASCEETGCEEWWECADCGKILKPQVVIPATGHTPYVEGRVEPTCEEDGTTGVTKCSVCKEKIADAQPIAKLGHLWDDGVVTTIPTLEATGVKTYTCQRTGCGATREETLPKKLPVDFVRNVSAVTTPGVAPTLPSTVAGLTAIGETSGDYAVEWDAADLEAARFTVGDYVTVHGTADVNGTPKPVTASVRVYNGIPLQVLLSGGLTPTCPRKQEYGLSQLTDGDYTKAAWGSYNYYGDYQDKIFSNETYTIQFYLNVAKTVRSFKVWYVRESSNTPIGAPYVHVRMTANGSDWQDVAIASTNVGEQVGAVTPVTYALEDPPKNMYRVEIAFGGDPSGESVPTDATNYRFVKLSELELFGDDETQGTDRPMSSPALSTLQVSGTKFISFAPTAWQPLYKYEGRAAVTNVLAESTAMNAGVTVLPIRAEDEICYVVSLAEDGSEQWVWRILFCSHKHTKTYGGHEPLCEHLGDTGTVVCEDCGQLVAPTEPIPALEHLWGPWTTNVAPTMASMGERSHTCSRCGDTHAETIAALPGRVPTLLGNGSPIENADGTWTVTGIIQNYKSPEYYVPEEFGFVLYRKNDLGSRTLTVHTPGRTKVTFDPRNVTVYRDGLNRVCADYVYLLKKFAAVDCFVVRPWMRYVDNEGISRYGYGDMFKVGSEE